MASTKIMQWIDDHQRGKNGIYPHQVALEVCAEFQISISDARDYVLQHIKKEMNYETNKPAHC